MSGDTLARLHDTLTLIASQQDITIIAACAIGSHAYELAGSNSDYDAEFLFAMLRNIARTRSRGHRGETRHWRIDGCRVQTHRDRQLCTLYRVFDSTATGSSGIQRLSGRR